MKTNLLDLSKRNFLCVGAAALASLKLFNLEGTAHAAANKPESLKGITVEEFESVKKMAQYARDVQDVQRCWSRHASYDAAGKNREHVDLIMAQHQPDVAFIQPTGMWVGLKAIKTAYVDWWEAQYAVMLANARKVYPDIPDDPKYSLVGWQKMHTNCTPNIVIAGDRKTAKGSWESPGYITEPSAGGNVMAQFLWERYFVDFIMEDGEWKIWHMNLLVQMGHTPGKSWVDEYKEQKAGGGRGGSQPAGGAPAGGQQGGAPGSQLGVALGGGGQGNTVQRPAQTPELRCQSYATDKLCGILTPGFPRQPEPYYTFSETHSYGPDMLESFARLDKKAKAK